MSVRLPSPTLIVISLVAVDANFTAAPTRFSDQIGWVVRVVNRASSFVDEVAMIRGCDSEAQFSHREEYPFEV